MKKLLSGAIAVCLICAALVGCGKGGETAASVIADLKEKGVPISYSIVYDDATDPNGEGPHDYKEKGNFADSRLETAYDESEPESGSVEIYKSEAAAKARAEQAQLFQRPGPAAVPNRQGQRAHPPEQRLYRGAGGGLHRRHRRHPVSLPHPPRCTKANTLTANSL